MISTALVPFGMIGHLALPLVTLCAWLVLDFPPGSDMHTHK